jgi:hypothetical protein
MTRPRGFAAWSPRQKSADLLDQVRAVLDEYAAHLPLIIRQIFYRLVATRSYEKTEQASDRLGEMLNRARRANRIPFEAIRDDGITWNEPRNTWANTDDYLDAVRRQAESFRLDRQDGQPVRIGISVESRGLIPQVEAVAFEFGVPVFSLGRGGFDSSSGRFRAGEEFQHWPRALILHVGDFDPSGESMLDVLRDDIPRLAAGRGITTEFKFERLAVTPAQAESLHLPSAPPKVHDKRGVFTSNETWQAEAIPPDVLPGILREAIAVHQDEDVRLAVLRRETRARAKLARILAGRGR